MKPVNEQTFDFTEASEQAELKKWIEAVRAIPFPEKKFFHDISLDEDDESETAFHSTYEFLELHSGDTWFWLAVLFKKSGKAEVCLHGSYVTYQEKRLIPIVNRFLTANGLEPVSDLNVWMLLNSLTWQEGYDLLCAVAQNRKIPRFVKPE